MHECYARKNVLWHNGFNSNRKQLTSAGQPQLVTMVGVEFAFSSIYFSVFLYAVLVVQSGLCVTSNARDVAVGKQWHLTNS